MVPKASNAAEHTEQICSLNRPSLPNASDGQRLAWCVSGFKLLSLSPFFLELLKAIFSVPVLFSPWLCAITYSLDNGENSRMDCFIHCSDDNLKIVAPTHIKSWNRLQRERERG